MLGRIQGGDDHNMDVLLAVLELQARKGKGWIVTWEGVQKIVSYLKAHDALISRVETMEKDNDRLVEFARSILSIVFEGGDIDGGTAQDMGVEYGLLERQDFDPKRHTDSTGYAEPGDDWYVFAGPAALHTQETE